MFRVARLIFFQFSGKKYNFMHFERQNKGLPYLNFQTCYTELIELFFFSFFFLGGGGGGGGLKCTDAYKMSIYSFMVSHKFKINK